MEVESKSDGPELVKGYTIALWTLAVLFLFSMVTMNGTGSAPTTKDEERWVFEYTSNLMFGLGLLTGWIAWLRTRASEYAATATAVFSYALIIWVPVGTAFSIYWFLRVRRIESAA